MRRTDSPRILLNSIGETTSLERDVPLFLLLLGLFSSIGFGCRGLRRRWLRWLRWLRCLRRVDLHRFFVAENESWILQRRIYNEDTYSEVVVPLGVAAAAFAACCFFFCCCFFLLFAILWYL